MKKPIIYSLGNYNAPALRWGTKKTTMKALIFISVAYAAVLWVMYASFQRWKRRTNTYINPADLQVGRSFTTT